MSRFDIIQISADQGIAPGSTKGAAQHLRGIAGGLHRRGHRVTTYTPRRAEGQFPTALLPLEDLARIDIRDDGDDRTIVYERYSLGHLGGLELARRLGVPFVLEVNAPLVEEAQRHRPDTLGPNDARVEAELLAAADLVITVSTALATWADARRAGPTVVVANGYEPAWFDRPATPGTPRFPLVFIGHPKPWHGADRLVDLLAALARIDRRPDLLVIGGGPGADTLRTAARDAGVGAQLTITGPLPPDEASAMLQLGGIGLAPYRRQDSFYFCPLKIIDYLAAGLAIVATDQGDIGDLVGPAGVVVAPDDDDRLVDAVVALLDDPAARAACGVHGRSRAMTSMTWDHVAGRTETAMLAHLSSSPVDA